MTTEARTYPAGVTSWIDVKQPDLDAAAEFYRGLLGWETQLVTPPGAPERYLIATLDGHDVAGLGEAAQAGWTTYVAVEDVDATAARVASAGGRVLAGPVDVGPAGRTADCADPERAHSFYTDVFGWEVDDLGFATMVRVPGYGDHLAATIDPGIHERQSGVGVPPGFADAIGWVSPPTEILPPQWHVTFTVADRGATAARAQSLGATILEANDSDWTHDAIVRDPQGAVFTTSQFDPQG